MCGPHRDSLVDDECASVPRLLSVCTRAHEIVHACRQAAQHSATVGGGHTRLLFPGSGRKGASPLVYPTNCCGGGMGVEAALR